MLLSHCYRLILTKRKLLNILIVFINQKREILFTYTIRVETHKHGKFHTSQDRSVEIFFYSHFMAFSTILNSHFAFDVVLADEGTIPLFLQTRKKETLNVSSDRRATQ